MKLPSKYWYVCFVFFFFKFQTKAKLYLNNKRKNGLCLHCTMYIEVIGHIRYFEIFSNNMEFGRIWPRNLQTLTSDTKKKSRQFVCTCKNILKFNLGMDQVKMLADWLAGWQEAALQACRKHISLKICLGLPLGLFRNEQITNKSTNFQCRLNNFVCLWI